MPVVTIPYKARKWAKPFHASFRRWACLVLHRRAGKTTAVLNHHLRAAIDDEWEVRRLQALDPSLTRERIQPLLRARHYGHIMPSYKQAKLVAWDMLKYYARDIPGVKPNEQELKLTLPTGSKIQLFGADNADSLRGPAFSGLSLDEYSQHPPNSFGEVLSKALADHLGYCIFAGTIKGKNHLYKTYEASKTDAAWFSLWQDARQSLATEDDVAMTLIEQAMKDDLDMISKGLMTQDEYEQEWFLSPTAAIKGTFYGEAISALEAAGQITRVPYEPLLPVETFWDLGIADSMSIWFAQPMKTGEIRVIDYYEATGEGLPHYVNVLKARGYVYGSHWAPHDIQVRELATGRSRWEAAKALGLTFEMQPAVPLEDGIHAVRMLLPRCWFDADKCHLGLECLRNYRKAWNEKMQEFTGTPVHNWASHGADSARGMAVSIEPPKPKIEAGWPSPLRQGQDALGWMGA